jgi:nucleoside-diphosphate-sugar epimerase
MDFLLTYVNVLIFGSVPLYISDLAQAFLSVLDGKGCNAKCYTVCGPRPEFLIDMIRAIQHRIGRYAPLVPIPVAPVKQIAPIVDRLMPFLNLPVQQIEAFGVHPPYSALEARSDLDFCPRSFSEALVDYL